MGPGRSLASLPAMAFRRRAKSHPFFSQEFLIHNHADIGFCLVLCVLISLMFEVSSPCRGDTSHLHLGKRGSCRVLRLHVLTMNASPGSKGGRYQAISFHREGFCHFLCLSRLGHLSLLALLSLNHSLGFHSWMIRY